MLKYNEITERIIKAYYHVYNALGYGFLERVYHNALIIELRKRGLIVQPNAPIKVYYDGQEVGEYFADLLVANCVIVELKAAEALAEEHHAQTLNYSSSARSMKPPVSRPLRKVAHKPHGRATRPTLLP